MAKNKIKVGQLMNILSDCDSNSEVIIERTYIDSNGNFSCEFYTPVLEKTRKLNNDLFIRISD